MTWNKNSIILSMVVFLVGVLFVLELGIYKNNQQGALEVSFLDVGQGDAILINYLHRYQILIDAGPSGKKVLTELAKVMPFGDNKIEIIISTHPDRDHFVGFIDVIKKYKVGLALTNGQQSNDELWQVFDRIINEKKIEKEIILEGSTLRLSKDVNLKIFNPNKVEENKKAKNDSSVVVRLDYLKNSFLFTGDAGFDAEASMIFDKENLDVDWLKIGHHGSRYSTSDFFLARTSPKYSIVSVGENDYGHPTEEVLTKLQKVNSKILRTDKLGTITITCENLCKIKK